MKKGIAIFLAIVLVLSTCSCGAKKDDSTASSGDNNSTEATATEDTSTAEQEKQIEETAADSVSEATEDTSSTEDDDLEKDMEELSAIGDVEVENGILTVSITLPAELVGEITQEELDEGKGTNYVSAVINDDGSVTYKMTKAQHKEMLASLVKGFDEGIQEMVDDNENYSIASVTYNKDFTVFDVTLDGNELGLGDSFSAMAFYMYGGMYGIFTGKQPEHVIVNYYDSEGNLIESGDSANYGN